MTCIIGVEDGERAYVIADSGYWRGLARSQTTFPKVWRSGDWVIGGAGAFTAICLAHTSPLPTIKQLDTESDIYDALFQWSVAYQKRLAEIEGSIMAADKDHTGDSPSFVCALGGDAALRGKVWEISHCAPTRRADGFAAAGARQFLEPAMLALASFPGPNPLDRARQAMRLALVHTDWAVPPFLQLGTDGSEGTFE